MGTSQNNVRPAAAQPFGGLYGAISWSRQRGEAVQAKLIG